MPSRSGLRERTRAAVEELRTRLDERYREPGRVIRLTTNLPGHPDHLKRTFRETYGETPSRYRQRLRVEHAQRLLRVWPRLPVWLVAQRVGYSSATALTRAFHDVTGEPPTAYRASLPPERREASRRGTTGR